MSCGMAHKEVGDTRRFIEAVACGQKFENPHFKHFCMGCGNRGSESCESECFFGTVCHYVDAETRETAKVAALTVPSGGDN
jgi:hypothetical protein